MYETVFYETVFDTYLAIVMVMAAVGAIVWFKRSELAITAGRMRGMMRRIGLDPGLAEAGDAETMAVLKEVRRRCGRCPREDFCDRWLAGTESGDNAFCRNASVFRTLLGGGRHAA